MNPRQLNIVKFNPSTFEVAEKQAEEVFVKESNKLVDIEINGETIKTTLDHPFYVPQKGFTNAVDLKAGDILLNINGDYVIVEEIQHEILESPITVYNFRVSNDHTYYVSNNGIATHNNTCAPNTGGT